MENAKKRFLTPILVLIFVIILAGLGYVIYKVYSKPKLPFPPLLGEVQPSLPMSPESRSKSPFLSGMGLPPVPMMNTGFNEWTENNPPATVSMKENEDGLNIPAVFFQTAISKKTIFGPKTAYQLWRKKGTDEKADLLLENSHGFFMFAGITDDNGKKSAIFNLNDKIIAVDLESKKQKTLLKSKGRFVLVFLSKDKNHLMVWEEGTAKEKREFRVIRLDIKDGAAEVLAQGDYDGFSEPITWDEENNMLFVFRNGQNLDGGAPLYFDLNTGALRQIPGLTETPAYQFSHPGRYVLLAQKLIKNKCISSAVVQYDFVDPASGEKIGEIQGDSNRTIEIARFSPDAKEVLYALSRYDESNCGEEPARDYYRMKIGQINSASYVEDKHTVLNDWYPDELYEEFDKNWDRLIYSRRGDLLFTLPSNFAYTGGYYESTSPR